jgi:uncharacterized phage infection (PIP) family protein YhgE
MARAKGLVLVLVVAAGVLLFAGAQAERDSNVAPPTSEQLKTLTTAASRFRFELRKTPQPEQCVKFVDALVANARARGLVDANASAKSAVGQFKRLIEMVSSRANGFKQRTPGSQMLAGLDSLVAFMKDCAERVLAPDEPSPTEPSPTESHDETVHELRALNQELKKRLVEKDSELAAVAESLKAVQDELASLESSANSVERVNNANESELRNCHATMEEVQRLLEQNRLLEQQVTELRQVNKEQKSDLDELSAQLKAKKAKARQVSAQIDELRPKIAAETERKNRARLEAKEHEADYKSCVNGAVCAEGGH